MQAFKYFLSPDKNPNKDCFNQNECSGTYEDPFDDIIQILSKVNKINFLIFFRKKIKSIRKLIIFSFFLSNLLTNLKGIRNF